MPAPEIERDNALWGADFIDPGYFGREQLRLRTVWSFLGFVAELPREGDWIRRDLWGCSVFVQRCGGVLKGFENRCAHRFFPLRLKDKGSGPIRCGYHGWQYDQDGKVVGIPMCKELFNATPRQIDARLRPLEIATCGELIFGRFAEPNGAGGLSDYLGEFEPILRTMSSQSIAWRRIDRPVGANWKFVYQISLDDYHIVEVHPSTFGANGPLKPSDFRYFRGGPHSALIERPSEDALKKMTADCAAGNYLPEGYRIFQIFPNLTVSHYQLFRRWYVVVMQYAPSAVDRTVVRAWYAPADFAAGRSALRRLCDRVLDVPRNLALRYGLDKVIGEDNAVCEGLQRVAHQASGPPLLGAQEQRVAWFDQAYAQAMTGEGLTTAGGETAPLFRQRAPQEPMRAP